jgi:membrane-associated protease RseP (regulator of RpoE activity)
MKKSSAFQILNWCCGFKCGLSSDLLAQPINIHLGYSKLDHPGDVMKSLHIFTMFSIFIALNLNANWQQENPAQGQNNLGGIGLVLDDSDEYLQIKEVLNDSPAAAAGFLEGDILWAINGCEAFYWDLSDAVNAIRGEVGTELRITVRRAGHMDLTALLVRTAL